MKSLYNKKIIIWIIGIILLFFIVVIVNYLLSVKEGYDCAAYLTRYSDLRNAFGSDCNKAFNHWINNGIRENRNSDKDPPVAGPAGAAGAAGAAGPAGPAGPRGDTGPAGIDGRAGPIGPAGIDGIAGIDGRAGPIGPAGIDGIAGINGRAGSTGPAGIDGVIGPTGPAGIDGINGSIGSNGQGPQGISRANEYSYFGASSIQTIENFSIMESLSEPMACLSSPASYM